MGKRFSYRGKKTVRYYLVLLAFALCLFFSNDFGLIDIQKTAIVIGAAIDRKGEDFLLTSQIAVPQQSKQGEKVTTVQIESRGKTVAEAFSEINAKTGWYPKLVFCRLIILGSSATERNVFEGLDYFLREEYMADNCLLAVCDGVAKDLLSVQTPIENVPSLAAEKVLSEHAARVGTALPSTLRTFASSHYSAAESGYIPVLTKTSETIEEKDKGAGSSAQGGGENEKKKTSGSGEKAETLYVADGTALFKKGRMTGRLNREQTFALAAVQKNLRLATFCTEEEGSRYSLLVKKNENKIRLSVGKDGTVKLRVRATLTAGVQDDSTPNTVTELAEKGALPKAVQRSAEKKIERTIQEVFQIARESKADIFGATEMLRKYHGKHFSALKDDLLERMQIEVKIKFQPLR